jgi:hypothetical protein
MRNLSCRQTIPQIQIPRPALTPRMAASLNSFRTTKSRRNLTPGTLRFTLSNQEDKGRN